MTKKHYEAIASIIKGHLHSADTHVRKEHRTIERYAIEGLSQTLADYFEQDNPRFDRERFLKACGIETEKTYWCHHYEYLPFKDYDLESPCGYCKMQERLKNSK